MYTYTTIREIVDKLNLEILNEGNLDLKIDIPNICLLYTSRCV